MKINITIHEYNNISQLTAEEQILIRAALDAADHSYSPYSGFSVGAAVLLENKKIIMMGKNNIQSVDSISDLLPLSFDSSYLPKKNL